VLLMCSVVKLFTKSAPGTGDDVLVTATPREFVPAACWMAAFFATLWLAGALVAVPLFTAVYLWCASRDSLMLSGGYAVALWAFVYGLFDRVLRVPLP
jgi:hypothetical protein